ncbi:MAG: hypothetical protein WCE90_08830, partial [Candidatus Zixiibacteriota bacterium]
MRKAMWISILTILTSAFFYSGFASATQDPNDLYGPDSVLFKSKQLLVPCPPQTGQAVVPVYFRNDT